MKALTDLVARWYRLNERESRVLEQEQNLARIRFDQCFQRIQLDEEWDRLERTAKMVGDLRRMYEN